MILSKYLLNIKSANNQTLWYHPISKALIYLPIKYNAIPEKNLKFIDNKIINELTEKLFIIPENFDEFLFYKYWYKNLQYSSERISFTIHTTFSCNLKCPYCYEANIQSLNKEMNSENLENIKKFIFKVIKDKNPKIIDFCYIGGEPLLSINNITYLCSELNKLKTPFSSMVVTNGTLLTRKNVLTLKKLGVKNFQVTIDGPKLLHDEFRPMKNNLSSFDLIISNLTEVSTLCNLYININLNRKNINSVAEIIKIIKDKKIKARLMFSMVFEREENCFSCSFSLFDVKSDWLNAHKEAIKAGYNFEPFYRNSYGPCSYFRENYFIIDPNGDLYKCISGVGNSKYLLGNVQNYGNTDYYSKLSNFLEVEYLDESCKKCNYLPLCNGGCFYKKTVYNKKICYKNDINKNDLLLIKELFKKY